jgi:ABC-2 type transport system permease protein
MTAFWAMTRVSLRHILGRKRLIGLGLFALVPAVVMAVLGQTASDASLLKEFHAGPLLTVLFGVLPITSLVLGAAALGEERRDGTLSFLLLRPNRRAVIVAAKLAAVWLGTFAVVGGSGAAAAFVLAARSGYWTPFGPALLGLAVSTLAYGAAALALGYLTSRAVLIGLAYLVILENGLALAIDGMATVSLMRIGLTAYWAALPDGTAAVAYSEINELMAALTPGAWGALAKALVIAGIVVVGIAWLLRHRDVA